MKNVDAGDIYGVSLVARYQGKHRPGVSVHDTDVRLTKLDDDTIVATVAFELSDIERNEIALGSRILVQFMGMVPVHRVAIEGVPSDVVFHSQ